MTRELIRQQRFGREQKASPIRWTDRRSRNAMPVSSASKAMVQFPRSERPAGAEGAGGSRKSCRLKPAQVVTVPVAGLV